MTEGVRTLDDFKDMLSKTFENSEPKQQSTVLLDDSFDSYDYEEEQPTVQMNMSPSDEFDEFDSSGDEADFENNVSSCVNANTASVITQKLNTFVGVNSIDSVIKTYSLRDEIENTIYNLGFTMENCIYEFNEMFGTNMSSIEELYSRILYNNYFKDVKVTDINSISVSDILNTNVAQVEEVAITRSDTSSVEKELQAVDYPDFIKQAVENNRIPVSIFDQYNDLFKALYIVDYLEAFGEEIELGEGSDLIYNTLVGRYMYGMSELDYKKIMYLTFRTDMCSYIAEKGCVESYADITFYKISKLLGVEVYADDKEKFYIATGNGIQAYTIDIVWHNTAEFLNFVEGLQVDVIEGKLIFFNDKYNGGTITNTINSESSLTEFVSKPSADDSYFYYNYNKFLDLIKESDIDASEELCNFLTNMTDIMIARYDSIFGNIVKYNKELIGCMTSKRFKLILNCMCYLPGREPSSFASYRLLGLLGPTLWRGKFTVATKNMTQELSKDCVSIDILGIPGITMVKFTDFWEQFDVIRTHLDSATKITLSVFNSLIRLKIE